MYEVDLDDGNGNLLDIIETEEEIRPNTR